MMLRQLTKKEAVALFDSKEWERWSHKMRAAFQLRQGRLCMPFDVFQTAVEKTLERSVMFHEFGLNKEGLIAEFEGKRDAPSIEDIVGLIPKEKCVVVVVSEDNPPL